MPDITTIKQIPIEDYAKRIGFTPVRKGSRYISLAEHDSVMIDTQKNAFWRNSKFRTGQGGAGSIIDFAMEFGGYTDVKAAIKGITETYGISQTSGINERNSIPHVKEHIPIEKEDVVFTLPPKALSSKRVFNYLQNQRGIDTSVIRYFISKGLLYQDTHFNCVFVSPEKDFACKRSTGGTRFVGDIAGSNYEHCFFLNPSEKADTLIVTESIIDCMSVMSYLKTKGRRYTDYAYLALSGTTKISSLYYHLKQNPVIQNVILSLDNDEAGHMAMTAAEKNLIQMGYGDHVLRFLPPSGKDWNEYIQAKRHEGRCKNKIYR